MEIVNIEARTFEAMMSRFEAFAQKVEKLCEGQDKGLKKWFDNQEVCQILNISKRSLQTYRDDGTLPYTQINHKRTMQESLPFSSPSSECLMASKG